MPDLPIHQTLPGLRRHLAGSRRVVLSAPPGSGKTTVVPLALLDEPWLRGSRILMLEPRRLAARTAAARMASLLGEGVGERVGYSIRLQRRVSAATRIEVVTEGILTRRLQRDPELQGVGLLIFDEFHERSLHADLGLALALDVMEGLRDDLRLLVMSATLDCDAVSRLLGGAPVVRGEGRSHAVELHYLAREPAATSARSGIVPATVAGVQRALAEQEGDLLVFLPGVGEIRRAAEQLQQRLAGKVRICPLYSDLDPGAQELALTPDPAGGRRVVLATSIAETSLTIEGIRCVVDSGWSRVPRFDPNRGLTRLETLPVSRASADQRAGRAGRLGPGHCYRLWTEARHARLDPHTTPEIRQSDLAPLLLELAQWGVTDPATLAWLDPPPAGALRQAADLLRELEALDDHGRITTLGRRILSLPVHPRLGRMLVAAEERGRLALGADLAALLGERDLLRRREGGYMADLAWRLQLLQRWRHGGGGAGRTEGVEAAACRRIDRVARALGGDGAWDGDTGPIGELLAVAYPDRIARRSDTSRDRYLLTSGRAVRLARGDPLGTHPWLVVAELDAGQREGRVFRAAAIELDQIWRIKSRRIRIHSGVEWDSSSESVVSRQEHRLGALVLSSREDADADPEKVRAAMLEGVRRMGLAVLPWSRTAMEWRARVLSLRHWQPDSGWPDLTDEGLLTTLDRWLAPWLDGVTRRRHLQRLDLEQILKGFLDWNGQRAVERLAPVCLRVPSGACRRLDYRPGEAPVLRVRLQEMFGLRQTPTVCDGRVPVLLHLLSPAQRAVQVTQDLAGFWDTTYAEVRKELKGRYPKHYWPEDPSRAVATSRVRPR
ncbi:MAG TPA: ATP-dependent helicase HrpB [Sedimenticola thiotaurini]|uniref:ATP-dependent helicase HrpB n=1 Tax=Sedimenticola thiotaurini TaxID=1543721 RepID=A0A831W2Q9_9GAMM|nr:ATP-dependent helicase HrpB [Sedimenticola thiotaurini]